jgi:hypothetical protein
MSLAIIANELASKGRGPDTMLVHMAPEEVRSLQALAKAHGGSLTINPETGLPEAGFLKSLLPALIGFGLNLVAPGVGSAIGSMIGASGAVGTGLLVGGVEALRTGDLGKGIMAGLGAYGGAQFGGAMEGLGAKALTGEGMSALVSPEAVAASGDISMSGLSQPELAKLMGATATPEQLAATRAALGPEVIAQRGFQAATGEGGLGSLASQMGGGRAALMAGAAAASPVFADMAVQKGLPQTKTTLPTAYIRPHTYDPYAQQYTALPPVKAEEAAGREFPYSIPPGMAEGGIADGGLMGLMYRNEPVVRMADGGVSTGLKYATGQGGIGEDKYYQNIANYISTNPNLTYEQAQAAMNQWGVSAADLQRASELHPEQLSIANVYAMTNPNIGAAANVEETYGGLKGISSNINYQLANDPNLKNRAAVESEMNKYGLNEADFKRATGKTLAEYFNAPVRVEEDAISYGGGFNDLTCPTGYTFDAAKNACVPITEELTRVSKPTVLSEAPETALAPGVGGSDVAVLNPNGTITTMPNIPDRPAGGFTGMEQVRKAYTDGGGSLGFTPTVPKTYADFLAAYDKTSGGSKSAYDYLMGKAGAAYPLRPVTPTGEVMRPYSEAVLGVPRPAYQNKYTWDTSKQQYVANPNYQPNIITTKDKDGKTITAVREADNRYRGADNNYYDAAGKLIEAMKKELAGGAESKTEEKVEGGDADGGLILKAEGGLSSLSYNLGSYSDGGRLLRGPGDGVSDSIPAVIGQNRPARLADGEFVVPARIVSELGNGSTNAGARKLYEMMDRVQKARRKTVGKGKVAKDSSSDKYLPA